MATSSPTLHESPSVEVDPIDPDGDGPPYPAPRNPVDIDAPGEHESADKSAPDEEDAPRSTSSDSGASPPLPEGTSRASSLKRASSLRHTNDGILQNTDFEPPLKTKVLAVAVPLTICVFCNLVYMGVSGVAQRTYLRFVEEHPRLWADNRRLPDLVLDLFENNGWHDSYSSMNFWTGVSDTFPLLILGLCTFYLVVYQHFVVINRCLLTQSFLISLNALAENLTILPSSYGYERCLDYLGINSSADLPGFSFSPTGTCSAMIWSGHCVHTLIAGHMLGCAIAEDHPEGVPWVPARVCRVVKPKTFLMFFLGMLEVLFLALARGHYSVDMMLGIMIVMLVMTNNSLKAIFLLINPYLKSMIDPQELKLLQMPHGVLREKTRVALGNRSNSLLTRL